MRNIDMSNYVECPRLPITYQYAKINLPLFTSNSTCFCQISHCNLFNLIISFHAGHIPPADISENPLMLPNWSAMLDASKDTFCGMQCVGPVGVDMKWVPRWGLQALSGMLPKNSDNFSHDYIKMKYSENRNMINNYSLCKHFHPEVWSEKILEK